MLLEVCTQPLVCTKINASTTSRKLHKSPKVKQQQKTLKRISVLTAIPKKGCFAMSPFYVQ